MDSSSTPSLKTDHYELTMVQAALQSGVAHRQTVFELFARRLPRGRTYGVVGGINRAIEAVDNFTFTAEQIEFLRRTKVVDQATLNYLADFSFTGNITAYQEGELYFPRSPIITVEAPFAQAVLLETVLLSILNYDSAVASAAARMVQAAHGMPIIEMGSRRTGDESAIVAARAAYLVGFVATSNLEAGYRYGVPTSGTAAHAFTLAHETERQAFEAQIASLGTDTTLLVDTYDIPQGIRTAIEVAGTGLGAIRIDSGDLFEETIRARALLDELGATETKIVVSSDMDEYIIDELLSQNAPIDVVGVGTRVVTGSGAPTAGMVYKLVAIESEDGSMRSVEKLSSGKVSHGGRKRAWRVIGPDGWAVVELVKADDASDPGSTRAFDEHTKPTDISGPARPEDAAMDAAVVSTARGRSGFEGSPGVDSAGGTTTVGRPRFQDTPTHRSVQRTYMRGGEVLFLPTLGESRNHHRAAIAELNPLARTVTSSAPALIAT